MTDTIAPKTVYILTHQESHPDYFRIVGVFASEEGAVSHRDAILALNEEDRLRWARIMLGDFDIEPHTVTPED